jgi:hypothetical protein
MIYTEALCSILLMIEEGRSCLDLSVTDACELSTLNIGYATMERNPLQVCSFQ